MESPSFCGQTCHTPMHPQFTAWQDAPHSQVACVQCHIGEGGRAFVRYKLNGLRQLFHVVTGNYPRPIPGVADLRPAVEVCGNCHWPGKGFGDVVRVKREYTDDETNTETATILQLFLGGPGAPATGGRAIHWHADPRVRIEFIYTDGERQTIKFVRVTRMRRVASASTPPRGRRPNSSPRAPCARWTASTAITSRRIASHRGRSRRWMRRSRRAGSTAGLPFVRREGVRLMKASHQTADDAARTIDEELRKYVVEDVGALGDHLCQRHLLAAEVGGQHLDLALRGLIRIERITPTNARGAVVRQVVAVDGRDHRVAQAHLLHLVRDAQRLERVVPGRHPRLDVAEPAAAGADVAEDHEGRRAALPALADVGAVRLLADRVQVVGLDRLLQLAVGRAAGRGDLEPRRLALAERPPLDPGRAAGVGARAGDVDALGGRLLFALMRSKLVTRGPRPPRPRPARARRPRRAARPARRRTRRRTARRPARA